MSKEAAAKAPDDESDPVPRNEFGGVYVDEEELRAAFDFFDVQKVVYTLHTLATFWKQSEAMSELISFIDRTFDTKLATMHTSLVAGFQSAATCKVVERERKNKARLLIEKHVASWVCKVLYLKKRTMAIKLQSHRRMTKERRKTEKEKVKAYDELSRQQQIEMQMCLLKITANVPESLFSY